MAKRPFNNELISNQYRTTLYDAGEMNMPNNQQNKKCRYCQESIQIDAKVCHHCGRHQNWLWQYFGDIGIIVSVGMLVLSIQQSITAQEASNVAIEAKNSALSAQEKTEMAYQDIKEVVKTFTSITYFQAVTKNEMGTERVQKATLETERELNKLLSRIFPDSNERSAITQDLNSRLPNKTN
jgi:hypothetical protein